MRRPESPPTPSPWPLSQRNPSPSLPKHLLVLGVLSQIRTPVPMPSPKGPIPRVLGGGVFFGGEIEQPKRHLWSRSRGLLRCFRISAPSVSPSKSVSALGTRRATQVGVRGVLNKKGREKNAVGQRRVRFCSKGEELVITPPPHTQRPHNQLINDAQMLSTSLIVPPPRIW